MTTISWLVKMELERCKSRVGIGMHNGSAPKPLNSSLTLDQVISLCKGGFVPASAFVYSTLM